MAELADQVALITGGASGLGRAITERFLEEGARVAVLDKSAAHIAALESELAAGDRLATVAGDVRELADNVRAVECALTSFGKLDTAVANAGVWDFSARLVDLPAERLDAAFDELFQVNVKGGVHLAKAALEPLVRARGNLLFTVSNAGFYPGGGGPLYTSAKHAVVGLIKELAFELAPYVRVNGVAPGAIDTDLRGLAALGETERVIPGEKIGRSFPSAIPLGLMPSPAEYAGAYVFFASRRNNVPATGAVLNHDGGWGVRGLAAPRAGDDLPVRLGIEPNEESATDG